MKKIITHLFIFSIFSNLVAQTNLIKILQSADSIYYSNPDSSYKLSQIAEVEALKTNDELNLANAKTYLARCLLLKSSLPEAQNKLNEAITIYSKKNAQNDLAFCFKLKAILLKRVGKLEDAIKLEEQAIIIYTKTNNTKGLIGAFLNISIDYIETQQYQKAQNTFNEIEKLGTQLSKTNKYFLHQNKGKLYAELKRFDVAIEEYSLALQIANNYNMIDSKATILMELGKAYRLDNKFEKSKNYLSQSELICVTNNLKHELTQTYEEIILLHQATGNYGLAYNFLKLQNDLKNEIINVEKINKINELEKKLAIAQKEKEIETEKLNTQKAQTKSARLFYIIVAMTLIGIILIIMIVRIIKLNSEIKIKNALLHQKQKEILDSIHYAKRIQQALLPNEKYIERVITESKKG